MRTGPHARLSVTSSGSALRPASRACSVHSRFGLAMAFLMRPVTFTKRGCAAARSLFNIIIHRTASHAASFSGFY